MNLVSVDMDIECTKNVKKIFQKYDFKNGSAVNMKGEEYLGNLGFMID